MLKSAEITGFLQHGRPDSQVSRAVNATGRRQTDDGLQKIEQLHRSFRQSLPPRTQNQTTAAANDLCRRLSSSAAD